MYHVEGNYMYIVLERLLSINLEYSPGSSKNRCKWGSSITRQERQVVDNLLQVTCTRQPLLLYYGA